MKRLKLIGVAVAALAAAYGAFNVLNSPPASEPSGDIVELDGPQSTDSDTAATALPSQSVPLPQVATDFEQLPSSPATGMYVPQHSVQTSPSSNDR